MSDERGQAPATAGDRPFVSVIIPVKDDEAGLARCLGNLHEQDYPTERFEVLVVDNGSARAPGAAVAAMTNARLLHEAQRGSYAARNRGLQEARGDLLAFTDADCLPSRDWISRAVSALEAAPGTGLVVGRVEVFASDAVRPRPVELYQVIHAFPQQRYVAEHRFGATANVATRRAVVDEVGPFDASLHSGGDKEWGRRIASAGWDVVYRDDVVVRHPARPSWSEYRRKLDRVYAGEFAARAGSGQPVGDLGAVTWRRLVPPVGSVLRNWSDPRLSGPRERVLYGVGAGLARWHGLLAGRRARVDARGRM